MKIAGKKSKKTDDELSGLEAAMAKIQVDSLC